MARVPCAKSRIGAGSYAQFNSQISALEQQITNVSTAQGVDALYFRADGSQTSADAAYAAPGTHGVAAGANAVAAADRSVAVGNGASANAAGAVALGAGASATAAGSVALGADSVATRENTVSVGAAGNERQITNVAAGTAPTDAVNVSQLQSAQADTINAANAYADRQVADVRRDSYAGIASAMAMASLPQAVLPGRGMLAMAGSTYGGQSAMALGASRMSDSGNWVYKANATAATQGRYGVGVGAGFHW